MRLLGDKELTENILQDSKVGRDFAGRDIINNNYVTEDGASDYMNKLYNDYKEECNINQDKKKIVEELEHYKSKLEGDVLGLEEKLRNANLLKLYKYAERVKESFFKKLVLHENSQSAQKIFLHLLTMIDSNFHMSILIQLEDGMSNQQIVNLVKQYIQDEVTETLKENLLGINPTDIDGMLFFLTGNCHINWT